LSKPSVIMRGWRPCKQQKIVIDTQKVKHPRGWVDPSAGTDKLLSSPGGETANQNGKIYAGDIPLCYTIQYKTQKIS
jgi:hypothetical protein